MAYGRKRSNKGRKCIRRKRVRVRGHGMALRCAKYGPKRSASRSSKRRSKKRGGYHKGHRPFNKGKKCKEWGLDRGGRIRCRSYGKVYGAGHKNRRRTRPGSSSVNTYESKMRRMVGGDTNAYNNLRRQSAPDESVPSWWVT